MMHDASIANAWSHCDQLVRTADPDRYWATYFAPADKRPYLFALYAFSQEIARVRDNVSAPLPGEIRFQWWRDWLDAYAGDSLATDETHPPVAQALAETITRFRLPLQPFHDLIDARVFDLYDDMMPSVADLEGYCGETSSTLFRLASLIIAGGNDPGGADAAGHGGVAFAVAGLLRALPWQLRRGQVFIPSDIAAQHGLDRNSILASKADETAFHLALADMRMLAEEHLSRALASISSIAPDARAAMLPLATVPFYLKKMSAGDYAPRSSIIDIPQWRRLWVLWRTSVRWRNL